MHSKWVFKHFSTPSKRHLQLLFVVWIAGFFLGMLLSTAYDLDEESICGMAAGKAANPVLLFFLCLLPVVMIVAALFTRFFLLAYPTVLLSSLGQGFSGFLVFLEQGSGAWLIRPMFLFSAGCTSTILWWLLICNCNGRRVCFRKDVCIAIASVAAVNAVDLLFITPFLTDLSKYF